MSPVFVGMTKRLGHEGTLEVPSFAKAEIFETVNSGYLSNRWATFRIQIDVLEGIYVKAVDPNLKPQEDNPKPLEDPPICIFCLENPQTSGFAHGNAYLFARVFETRRQIPFLGYTNACAGLARRSILVGETSCVRFAAKEWIA